MIKSVASETLLQQLNIFTNLPKRYRHWGPPIALKPQRIDLVQHQPDTAGETPYNEHKEEEHVRHQIVINDHRPALNASRTNEGQLVLIYISLYVMLFSTHPFVGTRP